MSATPSPCSGRTFRFVLLGLSGSGKTCLLTALTLNREPQPEGITCDWLEAGTASSRSHSVIQQAQIALTQQLVPESTHDPLKVRYQLFSEQTGYIQMEVSELDASLLSARDLERLFLNRDAVFVAVEAVHPSQGSEGAKSSLQSLVQQIHQLRERNQIRNVPVAVLVTKWDRFEESHNREHQLREYFVSDPSPPARSIVDALHDLVGPRNLKTIPVSAFGPHEVVAVEGTGGLPRMIERPRNVQPLATFNLEDGFLWAAQRRNEIDVDAFQESCRSVSSLKIWQAFGIGASPRSLSRKGRQLAERSASNPEARQALLKKARICQRAGRIQILLWVVILLGGVLAWEWTVDHREIKRAESLRTAQASSDELRRVGHWLQSYQTDPLYRHLLARFVLSKEDAEVWASELLARSENQDWQKVIRARGMERYSLAKEFQKRHPQSAKKEIALQIMAEEKQARERRENESRLQQARQKIQEAELDSRKLRSAQVILMNLPPHPDVLGERLHLLLELHDEVSRKLIQSAEKPSDEKEAQNQIRLRFWSSLIDRITSEALLEKLIVELDHRGLLYPALSDNEQRSKLQKQKQKAQLKLRAARKRNRWTEFRRRYQAMLSENQVRTAAKSLHERQPKTRELEKLCDDFRSRVVVCLRDRRETYLREQKLKSALSWLESLEKDRNLTRIWRNQESTLQTFVKETEEALDRALYRNVQKYRDLQHVDLYLTLAPLQKRRKEVQRFQTHLKETAVPMACTIVIQKVEWGGVKKRKSYQVKVEINGKTVIDQSKISASPGTVSGKLGSGKYVGKLSDLINLKMSVILPKKFLFDRAQDYGKGRYARQLRGLAGARVKLIGRNNVISYATFQVEGIPQEPTLPVWEE